MKSLFALCLMAFSALVAFASGNDAPYTIGSKVENFTLKNVDGKMVSLSDFASKKGVIVVFTCNHCPYAVKYEDRILALDKEFAPKGFPVLAINPNNPEVQPADSYPEMQKRAKDKKFSFPYVIDEGQKIYPKFGAAKTPHVFLLKNTKGTFTLEYIGAIDDNYAEPNKVSKRYVAQAISDIMAGKPVAEKETKAIGCSIKK